MSVLPNGSAIPATYTKPMSEETGDSLGVAAEAAGLSGAPLRSGPSDAPAGPPPIPNAIDVRLKRLRFLEMLRLCRLTYKQVSKAAGIKSDNYTKVLASKNSLASPQKVVREVVERDRQRSGVEDLCEYANRKLQEMVKEREKELVLDGSCVPWDPSQPYLFNVLECSREIEFVPIEPPAMRELVRRVKKTQYLNAA